jgi:hypothetical protein
VTNIDEISSDLNVGMGIVALAMTNIVLCWMIDEHKARTF